MNADSNTREMNPPMRTQVVVVGAGPCGVTIANYLGVFGIDTLLLERSQDILDYPRAVGADDEALRSWQGVGLANDVLKDMIQNVPARYYSSAGHCFAQVSPAEQPHGWPRRNLFIQPLTEVTLRNGLKRFDRVQVMLGAEAQSLQQDDEGVRLEVRQADGSLTEVRCDYLVGADGGRSTIRGLVGIELKGMTHSRKWLVIDVVDDPLDAPYTAIHCHPKRPSISIHLPYGFRRLEFQLMESEQDEEVLAPANLERLMRSHYPAGMALPEIKRARIYLHHSRTAERFDAGRVFLAGDAAHLQPPFFGQGMNSGLRDATNIAWKLALVIQKAAHPRILKSYDSERREHAETVVNFATWIGSFYKPHSRLTEWFRDLFFRSIQSLPQVRDYILQLKFKPMSRYHEGIVLPLADKQDKADPVGRMFMQPMVELEGKALKLDDAIGPRFAVLALHFDPASVLSPGNRAFLERIDARLFQVMPSRSPTQRTQTSTGVQALDDLQGKFRDWRMKHPQWEFIVVRPDRYVAAVGTRAEANALIDRLQALMA
jgi:3-(3-hydroxy-phenyl)propionate hydroxylase